jgi:phenylpyruvate tautomerase PptA (4-oxalocrotonate tautomerase family)
LGGRGRQISEFEASLVYRVSSSTARPTQRKKELVQQVTPVIVTVYRDEDELWRRLAGIIS